MAIKNGKNLYTRLIEADLENLLNPEKREIRKKQKELDDMDKERFDDYGIEEEKDL